VGRFVEKDGNRSDSSQHYLYIESVPYWELLHIRQYILGISPYICTTEANMKLTSVFQTITLLAASADAFNPRAAVAPKRKALWKPEAGTKWEIILSQVFKLPKGGASKLDSTVPVYDLDLFENDKSTFSAMQKAGKRIICYFSAGSWENWRDDKNDFPKKDLGKTMDGWPNEKWVNISSPAVRAIMAKRIKVAADKGCDAIDPDNMDGYVSQSKEKLECILTSPAK
jgi:hypothetical protein